MTNQSTSFKNSKVKFVMTPLLLLLMDTKKVLTNWADLCTDSSQRFDLSKEKIFHLKQQKGGSKGAIDQSSQKDLRILTYFVEGTITVWLTSCSSSLHLTKIENLLLILLQGKLMNPNWPNKRSAIQWREVREYSVESPEKLSLLVNSVETR